MQAKESLIIAIDHIEEEKNMITDWLNLCCTVLLNANKSRYYSVQLGHLTLFETLMLKFP